MIEGAPDRGEQGVLCILRPGGITGGEDMHTLSVTPRPLAVQSSWVEAGPSSAVESYLANLSSPKSVEVRLSQLRVAARLLTEGHAQDPHSVEWGHVRYEHVSKLRRDLLVRYDNPGTARAIMHAVQGVCIAAESVGALPLEALEKIRRVKRITGYRKPKRIALREEEMTALLATCDRDATVKGLRDAAIISLMYRTGFRCAELVGLDVRDYDRATGLARVIGKGNKERRAYVSPNSKAAGRLARWLEVRGDGGRALFLQVKGCKGQYIPQPWRLKRTGLYRMLIRREQAAGVRVTCLHDMRRTFASALKRKGAKLEDVQEALGHASPQTTAMYFVLDDEDHQQVVGLLDQGEP